MDYLKQFECFKDFNIEYTTDLSKYINFSINECTRWSITHEYYKHQIQKCNIGIFITYNPVNFNKPQICAFIIGIVNSNNLIIKLVASKTFLEEEYMSPSFGIYLIYSLILKSNPSFITISDVIEDKVKYYEHFGFKVDSNVDHDSIMSIYNMMLYEDINVFQEKIKSYIMNKFDKFNNYILSNNKMYQLYSCA